jgi:hypothetical protein
MMSVKSAQTKKIGDAPVSKAIAVVIATVVAVWLLGIPPVSKNGLRENLRNL